MKLTHAETLYTLSGAKSRKQAGKSREFGYENRTKVWENAQKRRCGGKMTQRIEIGRNHACHLGKGIL